jgi:hypothetical protein
MLRSVWVYSICALDLTKNCKFIHLVIILHFGYIFMNLRFQYDYHKSLFQHPDLLGSILNLLEMILPLLCHLTIVVESFMHAQKHEEMLRIVAKLNLHFQLMNFPLLNFIFLFLSNSLIYIPVLYLVNDSIGMYRLF